jgi:cytochrome c-type biogenesis protein CcmH
VSRGAALLLLALALPASAQVQAPETASKDPRVEERMKDLAEELRCLVCQNQTIADSNASLAVDLRGQIRTQIAAGRSDQEIRDYMVQRYGDFVLYSPPLKATTALLWAGPALLILGGAAAFVLVVRRRRTAPAEVATTQRHEAVRELLERD